jgi:multiple sugar transport system permease protein
MMESIRSRLLGKPKSFRKELMGLLFISPWLIGFLMWTVYPLGSSFYYSFTRYDILRDPIFIGLDNYKEIFFKDTAFQKVMGNTLYYVALGSPLYVIAAFLLANLLNTKILGRSWFRAIFFIPSIVPAVVIAMVWSFLLNVQYGAINGTLQGLGLPVIRFLSSPELAKPTMIMINIWGAGSMLVIFLASLQDVPRELYEAATMDGANSWDRFLHITIPFCSPVMLYNLIMSLIWGFQDFTMPMLLTGGGPNQATEFYALYLYRNAFDYLRMGKASALAWILFVIIVLFTFLIFKSTGRWVYYGGGESKESA